MPSAKKATPMAMKMTSSMRPRVVGRWRSERAGFARSKADHEAAMARAAIAPISASVVVAASTSARRRGRPCAKLPSGSRPGASAGAGGGQDAEREGDRKRGLSKATTTISDNPVRTAGSPRGMAQDKAASA
jgi:hypothetical protein